MLIMDNTKKEVEKGFEYVKNHAQSLKESNDPNFLFFEAVSKIQDLISPFVERGITNNNIEEEAEKLKTQLFKDYNNDGKNI